MSVTKLHSELKTTDVMYFSHPAFAEDGNVMNIADRFSGTIFHNENDDL